jgi:hypothetical protein
MAKLINYLPSPDEVNECIKPEAEGAHEAVLLAVHRPAKIAFRYINKKEPVASSEQDLLNHVLTANVPTGALVVPITGISGVGKSHLIRILHLRLQQRVEARNLHIIRIPKSASLRRVVELMLEPLPNEPRFAEVRAAFGRAMAEVNVESAAVDFRACLIVALEQRARELAERFKGGDTSVAQELDHCRRVHLLFDDPVTAIHFRETVFPRIVMRTVSGSGRQQVNALAGQFKVEDFILPISLPLGNAAKDTRSYYNLAINQANGNGRITAAKVLNSVVNEAISRLFNLHDSLGGMTLQEIILEIRRGLLQEGKDLVLLIEDFAALTGVQDTLSKVLIQEGVRDGERIFATMRSVVAVTDGWTIGRETIATRAEREWIVESHFTDAEVLERTREMVAAYLNASRYGYQNLVRAYGESQRQQSTDEWPKPFRDDNDDDETAALLDAFGYVNDIPLFPYTIQAIDNLAAGSLTEGQQFVFNPRLIVNQILRRLLLDARELYEASSFPPSGLEAQRPSAAIAELVNRQPERLRARYATTLVVWGNSPQEIDDVRRIAEGVFVAFELPKPSMQLYKKAPAAQPPPVREESPNQETAPRADPKVKSFQDALERWIQGGQRLQQDPAAVIRTLIVTALKVNIDLNAERCRHFTLATTQISIPNAMGQGNLAANAIVLAPDAADSDGRLRRELLSLYRLNEKRGQWYEDLDDDMLRVGALIDRLMPQALAVLRAEVMERCAAVLNPLVMTARVVGLGDVGKSMRSVREAAFQKAPDEETLPEDAAEALKEWRTFQADCRLAREALQREALITAGCFQGTGSKPLAVDIVRIASAYRRSLDGINEAIGLSSLPAEDSQRVRALADSRVRARVRSLIVRLRAIGATIEAELGLTFDKKVMLDSAKSLAEILQHGHWNSSEMGLTYPAFKSLCDSFQSSAVREAQDQLAQLTEHEQNPTRSIALAGQINFRPLLAAEQFVKITKIVNAQAKSVIAMLDRQFKDVDVKLEAEGIRHVFQDLSHVLLAASGETINGAR